MRIPIVAFVSMAVSVQASVALAYCNEPSAPSCADRYGAFDDEWEFSRCKSEMETYKSDVETFLSCTKREAEAASDKAISEYNDAVESFNRRAGR
ncbi:hypothetical protein [Rhizobium hainanense]|uniref:Uncharacterized protein n=1 Tax=Rhizobium hainanense TaxID=52131 RepID=A0A1C3UC76_9HYPH|nr:hypothetical protein [Rhizobium hainanense]SCB13091.1 hypothetical protein GA0061100_1011238 [Rhizobium hainanense]